jgi:hypothetical protein
VSEIDLQPDVHEVIQEEAPDVLDVPVCITDQLSPLRVQVLPRKGGATSTRTVTTTPLRVLTADPRRGRAQLISTAAANVFLVAFTETAAQDESTMAPWMGGVPFEHTAATEVWVRLPSTGTPFTIGVVTELWAEGEGPRG